MVEDGAQRAGPQGYVQERSVARCSPKCATDGGLDERVRVRVKMLTVWGCVGFKCELERYDVDEWSACALLDRNPFARQY